MEKTYRHKKTGEIAYYKDGIIKVGNCSVEIGVEPSSEFWVELTYEILSFRANTGLLRIKDSNGIFQANGDAKRENTTEQYLLNEDGWDIHSVKRLSDGEVFSIGDKINFRGLYGNNSEHKYDTIRGFDLKQDANLGILYHNGLVGLSKIEKYKESILTTEDGITIFEGDVHYYIWLKEPTLGQEINKIYKNATKSLHGDEKWLKDVVTFSTKESAEKYLKENEKKYSLNDIKEIVKKLDCFGTTLIEYLEKQ